MCHFSLENRTFYQFLNGFHWEISVHSTLSPFSPGAPNAMATAGGGTAEGLTTVEAAATAAETAEGVPLGLALPGKIYPIMDHRIWIIYLHYTSR